MANVNQGAFDFSGYATKNDLLCADGRTIRRNAFKECDGQVVPLVWNHGSRDNPHGILGHALLENRDDGVYMYGAFNDTEDGQLAKEYVRHGDITGLSIWANKLKQKGGDVLHGIIREVSLVLSGANPGAKIDVVMAHGEDFEDELYYELGIDHVELKHSADVEDPDDDDDDNDSDETVGDVLKTLNDKQKAAVIALIKAVEKAAKSGDVKHADDDDDEDDDYDEETVGGILDTLNKKQKAAVAMMIDSLMADRSFAHADEDMEEGNETIGEVLETLTDDEKAAVEALIDAIRSEQNGQPTIEHSMLMHADMEEDDGPTLAEVLEGMSDKKQAAVMAMIETLTGESVDDEEEDEEDGVEHGYYDDDYYEEDDVEHADGPTVGDVLESLTDEEKVAVEALIDAIKSAQNGQPTMEHSMLMHADPDDEDEDGPTLGEVLENMSDEKQAAVMTMIETLTGEDVDDEDEYDDEEAEKEEEENMMRHAYDSNYDPRAGVNELFADAMNDMGRFGSLREAMMAHSNDFDYDDDYIAHAYPTNEANKQITYGMADVEYLFPEARLLNNTPDFIKRDTNWVNKFMGATHKSPFSRVKTVHANITADEARAKGYVKGNQKVDEVFTLLKRVTNPTTVYKTQAMDRDDLIDIRDFGVVAWIKAEMRMQLDEEIARAALIGDGRSGSSNDKISELSIRPIYTDDSLYSIKVPVVVPSDATDDDKAKAFIKSCIKARKDYKGSGNPTLYTTSEMLTAMLLLEDGIGRSLYSTEAELATKLRVREIIEVPVMEGIARADGAKTLTLAGIVVNPVDYNFGADDGGKTSFFDDFDIQFNKERYLVEARCSGALTVPYSAMVLELDPSGPAAHTVTPADPTHQ